MMRIFTRLACLCVLFSASLSASAGVIKGGLEWYQPNMFTSLSWNQVASVCDPASGACVGTLNEVDVTGLTWASIDDVNELFNFYLPAEGQMGPGPDSFLQQNSLWAPQFLIDFSPTNGASTRRVSALTRTFRPAGTLNSTVAFLEDSVSAGAFDIAGTNSQAAPVFASGSTGVWLFSDPFQQPMPVPAPSVLILFILGLAGIWSTGYRRQKQACL